MPGGGVPPVAPLLIVCLLLHQAGCAYGARPVWCDGALKPIPSDGLRRYETFFRRLNTSVFTLNPDEAGFEALDGLETVMTGGADLGEALVALNTIAAAWNGSVASFRQVWGPTWWNLGNTTLQRAERLVKRGARTWAAALYHRAAVYLQMAGHFSDHLTPAALARYHTSVDAFEAAIQADPGHASWCHTSPIPYRDESGNHSLHAYMCRPGPRGTVQERPTIIAVSGYDSSAEFLYHAVAVMGNQFGYNVYAVGSSLVYDGPGQGATVRFQGLHFRPDWEFVTQQVLLHAATLAGVNTSRVVLWGRSFGGFLAPRAAASMPAVRATVANGAVLDFYQALLCDLGDDLAALFLQHPSTFDDVVTKFAQTSLGLEFLLTYGRLGFNATTPSQLFDTLSPYSNAPHMNSLQAMPMFINDPPYDALLGNQSALFFAALPQPRNQASVLHQDDPALGAALHCSLGSSNTALAAFTWLDTLQL